MPTPGVQVVVTFSKEISLEAQGPALLALELMLRTMTKLDVRVTKDLMGDDSKFRRSLTLVQREKL